MKNATRNWKTTTIGILMLAMAAVGIWHDPTKATDPSTISMIAGGVGLIAAKDGDKTGTAEQAPAQPAAEFRK